MADTESDVEGLQEGMVQAPGSGGGAEGGNAVEEAVAATFARDGKPAPVFDSDGSVAYQ